MKRDLAHSWPLAAAAVALVVAGCLPAPGADNAFYVLLPYAAAIVACVLSVTAYFGITFRRQPPEGYDREASLSKRTLVAAICSAATALGELAHVVFVGTSAGFGYAGPDAVSSHGGMSFALAFVLLCLAAAYCLTLVRKGASSGVHR